MIKFIFSDLDDTLLDSNKNISKDNLDTIKKANDKGIKFLINTGRLPSTFMSYKDILDLSSYVCGNGSLIQIDNKVIYSKPLNIEDRFKIYNYANLKNIVSRVYTINELYALDSYPEDENMKRFPYIKVNNETLTNILRSEDVYKICFYHKDTNLLKEIEEYIAKNCEYTFPTYSNPCFLETNHIEVSKGKGIDIVAKLFKLSNDEILVMGDNYNDLGMLDNKFISACPFNSVKEVKEVCDYISPLDANNSAVSEIIKHFCDL